MVDDWSNENIKQTRNTAFTACDEYSFLAALSYYRSYVMILKLPELEIFHTSQAIYISNKKYSFSEKTT